MAKWIRFDDRHKSQKFRCPHCGKVCYCRANGNTSRTYCDYVFCPYCGEKVEGEDGTTD